MSDETQTRSLTAEKIKREAIELVRFVLGVVIVFVVITTVLFRSFYIPSGSMEPTLRIHDRVLVLNFVYGWSRHSLLLGLGSLLPPSDGRLFGRMPGRGDVIVFRHPDPDKRDHLIKRVIGLPGDEIQMREGRLYINGEMVPREEQGRVRYRRGDRGIVTVTLYKETLPGGRRHDIYEMSDSEDYDNTGVFIVPENHVFVMGDNRDGSSDSRVRSDLGYVPVESIVGRAVTVIFTFHFCRKEPDLQCPPGRWLRGL